MRLGLSWDDVVVESRVGQGGSGEVFSVKHKRTGARLAAKVYDFTEKDPAFKPRERFRRECRILSSLRHPAFPSLYGCGELEDGQGYAIMEWIEGLPLGDLRAAGAGDVMRIAHGMAVALLALHRAGYVHRDIAFDNVLVEKRRYGLFPRLIDLGVAKELETPEDLTQFGNFLGRVEFASPELLSEAGAAGASDAKTDVFAFGVLLYEWLAGQPPFPGETPGAVLKSQKKRSAPRLSLPKDRGEFDASLPEFISALLAFDPKDRPETEEVVDRLVHMRRLHPPTRSASPAPAQLLSRGDDGTIAIVRRTQVGAPPLTPVAPGQVPLVSEEPPKAPAVAIAPPGPAVPPPAPGAAGAPQGSRGAPPSSAATAASEERTGRLVLILGIAALLLACAGAAFLLLRF